MRRIRSLDAAAMVLGLLGIAVRLIGITQPYIDPWGWRQSDVAMIARNFFRQGYHLFYPQIDWAGPVPGFVGGELQIVPFVAALLYPLLGVHDWIGRSVSVGAFAISLPFLFRLVRQSYGDRAAVAALGFYGGAPLGIAGGRSFMPDMSSVSLSLVTLGLFTSWVRRRPNALLFGATAVTLGLATVVKPSAAIVGCAFLARVMAVERGRWFRDPALWSLALLGLGGPALWYAHAYRISEAHPPYHFFGSGGIGLVSTEAYARIAGELVFKHLTPVLVSLAVIGFVVKPREGSGCVFHAWGAGLVTFGLLAGEGHVRHEWYLLGFVPVMAVLAGVGLDRLLTIVARTRSAGVAAALAVTVAVAFVGWTSTRIEAFYEPRAVAAYTAGMELSRLAPEGALIVVADWGDPTTIYYSDRKGWHFSRNFGAALNSSADAIEELEALRRAGARYLVFVRHWRWWLEAFPSFSAHLDARYSQVREHEDYVVFDLAPPRAE